MGAEQLRLRLAQLERARMLVLDALRIVSDRIDEMDPTGHDRYGFERDPMLADLCEVEDKLSAANGLFYHNLAFFK